MSGNIASEELAAEIRLFREELRAVRAEMKEVRTTMADFTTAISRCNKRIDDLATRVEVIEHNQNDRVTFLEQTITELKLDLNDRDQEMLRNDVEISGIPETKNEGTLHLVLVVAGKLGLPLNEADVVSAERVGPVRPSVEGEPGPRPRPLAVRLARRGHRDQILAAARVRRHVTTEGMDLTETPRPIYVNERLTRSNRQIFRKAREASKSKTWKYVWTREGKIFARQGHGTLRHRLRTNDDVIRVFGYDDVGASQ